MNFLEKIALRRESIEVLESLLEKRYARNAFLIAERDRHAPLIHCGLFDFNQELYTLIERKRVENWDKLKELRGEIRKLNQKRK